MGYVAVGFCCFFAGFLTASLLSANKCGECLAERMEAEKERK